MTYSIKTSVTVNETKTRTKKVHIGISQRHAHPYIDRNRWIGDGVLFPTCNGPSYKSPEKYRITILTSLDANKGDRTDAADYYGNDPAITLRGKDIPEQSFIEVRPHDGGWIIDWECVTAGQWYWLNNQLKGAIVDAIEKNKDKLKQDAFKATVDRVHKRIEKAEKELEELKKEAHAAIEKMQGKL